MANLDNYLRKNVSGNNTYYGYSSVNNPSNGDPVWSIKLVSGTSSETITWSNGNSNLGISIWDNRTSYFATQSSLNLTYSVSNNSITLLWDDLSGVDIYKISISNGNRILNDNNIEVYRNPNFDNDPSTNVYHGTSSTWRYSLSGVTYSATVTSYNVIGGFLSESVDIYVP